MISTAVEFVKMIGFCSHRLQRCLQCFDTVGWAAGRASGL